MAPGKRTVRILPSFPSGKNAINSLSSFRNSIGPYDRRSEPKRAKKTQVHRSWIGSSESLLLQWLEQPDNYTRLKCSGRKKPGEMQQISDNNPQTRKEVLLEIVQFLVDNGEAVRTETSVMNKLKDTELTWKKACDYLERIGAPGTANCDEKMRNPLIKKKVLSLCRLWQRVNPIFSQDADLLTTCYGDSNGGGDESRNMADVTADHSSASDEDFPEEEEMPDGSADDTGEDYSGFYFDDSEHSGQDGQTNSAEAASRPCGFNSSGDGESGDLFRLACSGLRPILPKASHFAASAPQVVFEARGNLTALKEELILMNDDEVAQKTKLGDDRNLEVLVDYAKAKMLHEVSVEQLKLQREEMHVRSDEADKRMRMESEMAEKTREHELRKEELLLQKEELRLRMAEAENQKLILQIQLAKINRQECGSC